MINYSCVKCVCVLGGGGICKGQCVGGNPIVPTLLLVNNCPIRKIEKAPQLWAAVLLLLLLLKLP